MAVHDLRGDHRRAQELAREALGRNPTYIHAQAMEAITEIHLGHPAEGTQRLELVMTAGRDDASHPRHQRELALGHWLADNLAEGVRVITKLWMEAPSRLRNGVVVAALTALAGDLEEARRTIAALQRAAPGLTLATARLPRIGDREAAARFREALKEAGL
jgi:hypothetical protein